MDNQNPVDQDLWRIARKRVGFKRHFATYIVINLFLWALWWFTDHQNAEEQEYSSVPWPIFSTIGWGIGVLMSYLNAYVFYSKRSNIEKEYEKLKNR
jgi:2TM domain